MDLTSILNRIYQIHDDDCNQYYQNGIHYSKHLKETVQNAITYWPLKDIPDHIIIGAAGHDLIEDARTTYHDIIKLVTEYGFSKDCALESAEIVYACTDEKGRDRSSRHSDSYFEELAKNRDAVFVKLCDLLANVTASVLSSSVQGLHYSTLYKSEFNNVKKWLYKAGEYDSLWKLLEWLLK